MEKKTNISKHQEMFWDFTVGDWFILSETVAYLLFGLWVKIPPFIFMSITVSGWKDPHLK